MSFPAAGELLAAFGRAMAERGLRWYVFGALAVVSAEDLLAMKILAGRRKDLEDVRGVLVERRGRLDLARTREVLAAFQEATGERTLLARLERVVKAAEKEGGEGPAPKGQRRR